MIRFKDFLVEARMAPLYHATQRLAFASIMKSGDLLPLTRHDGYKLLKTPVEMAGSRVRAKFPVGWDKMFAGISTTRSLEFAKDWGRWIFVLDQQSIQQRYEIVPINYFTNNRNHKREKEEYIITEKPLQLSKYLKSVMIPKKDRETFRAQYPKFPYPVEYY